MLEDIINMLQNIIRIRVYSFLTSQSGYWFATFLCIVIMIASTPTAHILSLIYKKFPSVTKDATLISTRS